MKEYKKNFFHSNAGKVLSISDLSSKSIEYEILSTRSKIHELKVKVSALFCLLQSFTGMIGKQTQDVKTLLK